MEKYTNTQCTNPYLYNVWPDKYVGLTRLETNS